MLTTVTFALFILGILLSILMNVSIVIPMLFGSVLFGTAAVLSGHGFSAVLKMMWQGLKKGLFIFFIFILVGMLTAAWRASGTIAFFVYWGTRLIHPDWFILCAFLMTAALAYLVGTSFGSIGTLGVMLMVLARTGDVSPVITAGAIIAGSYFGDRGSPASSSAILVSRLTDTDLSHNVKTMLKTGAVPFLMSCLFYAILSQTNPLSGRMGDAFGQISACYNLSPLVMLPALAVLILPLVGLDIRITMGASLATAGILAVFLQGEAPMALLRALFLGYDPAFEGSFAELIRGGGLSSMIKASCVVLAASTYAGIFQNTDLLKGLETKIRALAKKIGLFPATVVTATAASMLACNQTLAVMMTEQLMEKAAADCGADAEQQAQNLENSVITISPLIPWNIAVSVGLAVLSVGPGAILFACYLYFIPLGNLVDDFVHHHHHRGQRPAPHRRPMAHSH